MQVKDEDEEVDGQCGTKHWMAPEVEKSLLCSSPIKADRWSCGYVVLYFLDKLGKEDELLRAIARKLMAHNPKQRPSLLKCHTWVAAPLQDVPNVGEVIEQKAPRPRQDIIEVDGESMKPPKAKRRSRDSLYPTRRRERRGFQSLINLDQWVH
jgi:hypothetical protein